MPSTVTASHGDTLCNLAVNAGFLNCQPLRDQAANSGLLNRDLQDGDIVTIPDVRPRVEDGATDKVHKFVLKTAPPVSIRYVHGSPDKHYLDDDTTTLLNISNFVTNLAGNNGQQPFPAEVEFHEAGHVDPDTFKVEVVDPLAGASLKVLLEAMKPSYASGPTGAIIVTGHQPFQGSDHADRSNNLTCAKVRSGVAYRSKYLRLVVDEKDGDPHPGDKQKVREQTLLVTDMANGLGTGQPGDDDTVEILDQEVRASYTLQRCPAPDPNKCTVRTQAPIGGSERRRLRVAWHILRTSPGGPVVGGATDAVTLQGTRLRTFKWLRRVLAQANIAPKLSTYSAEIVDPPPPNMIVIAPNTGAPPSGITNLPLGGVFGNNHSGIFFTLSPFNAPGTFADTPVNFDLTLAALPREPIDVANALIAALPPGFTGTPIENPPVFNRGTFNTTKGSCDVIITRNDGTIVSIHNESTDDNNTNFRIAVPHIIGTTHPQAPLLGSVVRIVTETPGEAVLCGSSDERRIIRAFPGSDDVLDFYVVDFLDRVNGSPAARGSSNIRGREVAAGFEALIPVRNCCFIARCPDNKDHGKDELTFTHSGVELSDFNYHTLPHETGHILGDLFHLPTAKSVSDFHNSTDIMGVSAPKRFFNAVDHPKRIPDDPVSVGYIAFDPAQNHPGDAVVRVFNVVVRMRTEGAGLIEPW